MSGKDSIQREGEQYGVRAHNVEAESLNIGSASSVQGGPAGNKGEWVLLNSSRYSGSASSISTTYERGHQAADSVVIGVNDQLTNITEHAVSFSLVLQNDTAGETSYAKLEGYAGTEVTHTGTGFTAIHSPIVSTGTKAPQYRIDTYLKASGGTATIEKAQLNIWGKLA